jgi:hypothetical protein
MWSVDEQPDPNWGLRKFIVGKEYFPVHQVLQDVSARVRRAFACASSGTKFKTEKNEDKSYVQDVDHLRAYVRQSAGAGRNNVE